MGDVLRAPEKSVLILEEGESERRNSFWFRKQSSVSFLEPAIDLARRLSVRFNGPRGQISIVKIINQCVFISDKCLKKKHSL